MAGPDDLAQYATQNNPNLPPDLAAFAAKPEAAAQPSAASRFGVNLAQGLGVTSNEQAKNFFAHPLDTVIKSFEAQGELAKKAREAYDKGDYVGALQHGLNYLVPFVGQQTDQAGEQLKQGDYAGGIGRTLGAAAPIIAGSPEARATAADVATAAGEKGASAVRAGARAANKAIHEAPGATGGAVGGAAGAAIGRATDIPYGGLIGEEIGRNAGIALGKKFLPNLNIPGEGFGLPSRVTGGPASLPLSALSGEAGPESTAGSLAQSVTEPKAPAWTGNLEERLAANMKKIQTKEARAAAKSALKAAQEKAEAGDYSDILSLSLEQLRAKKSGALQ